MSTTVAHPLAAGIWSLDPIHSRVGFAVVHLGINTVRGRFRTFEGTLQVPDGLSRAATATAVIETASIDTHFPMRDEHLRSPAFFDVDAHPRMTFTATSLTPSGPDRAELVGDLTLRGVTRPVTLQVHVLGTATDQFGHERVGVSATGTLQRTQFGIAYDERVAGIPVVADTVTLLLDLEAVRQT